MQAWQVCSEAEKNLDQTLAEQLLIVGAHILELVTFSASHYLLESLYQLCNGHIPIFWRQKQTKAQEV